MSGRTRFSEEPDGQTDGLSTMARREWAWEFLRRNPDYRRDWSRVVSAGNPEGGSLNGRELSADNLRFRRWGLIFRRYAGPGRMECKSILGSGDLPACPQALCLPATR